MRDIYQKAQQVLIWRGEETAYTGGAIRIIPQFAEALDSLNIAPENFTNNLVKDPSEIPCGTWLAGLTSSLVWTGIVGLLS
jgi:hypothetical protein